MQLNYFGTVHLLKAAINGMLKAGTGRIVIVTSVAATIGAPLTLHTNTVVNVSTTATQRQRHLKEPLKQ